MSDARASGSNEAEVRQWAARIKSDGSLGDWESDLTSHANGLDLLRALAAHEDPLVRGWAGWAAIKAFGTAGSALALALTRDRDADVREAAREDLLELDPSVADRFRGEWHGTLRKGKDRFGEDAAAMWNLVRHPDADTAEVLRSYGLRNIAAGTEGRIPIALADFLDDPSSIARRVSAHDHDWMPWLVRVAVRLPIDDVRIVLERAREQAAA